MPITLGKVGTYTDILTINEDGSATNTQNTQLNTLTGYDAWTLVGTGTANYYFELTKSGLVANNIISNLYPTVSVTSTDTNIGISNTTTSIRVRPSATEPTLEAFKASLNTTNLICRVAIATPVVVSIDKSLCPTILTQATNTFQFGEAVAPTSVTIKAPTTDDITKSYTVSLLNAYTQTVGTATPVVDLLKDGKVRLQMDLTAPSTGMNATLFTLPTELRPITSARIPVFINGVCVLGVVDKTTGNVNLPSVPSANANIYIKTDYRRDN